MGTTQTGLFERTFWCSKCRREVKSSLTLWLLQWPLCKQCAGKVEAFNQSSEAERIRQAVAGEGRSGALVYRFLNW